MATKDTNYLVAVHKGLDESLEKQVAALPEKFNKQRFLQNCMTVLQDGQADFSKCEAPTVVRTLLKGAFLGLDFFNGECYAIPYGNQCQFQTDYKGEIKLCKRYSSNPIQDIYAKVVREGDEFEEVIENGKQYVNFRPKTFSNGEIIGAFAVVLYKDGSMMYDTMSKEDIEHTRQTFSKAANSNGVFCFANFFCLFTPIRVTRKTGVFGCYEVTIGFCGRERVDYMTYDTKGVFRCYEIKVSKADFHSAAAKSFVGHYNYYVLTRELYNQVKEEIPDWIGVYIGDYCAKKAKKQDLSGREYKMRRSVNGRSTEVSTPWVDMLKESMIRSLYRDSDKLIQTEDEQYISRLRSQIDKTRTERDRESKKYLRLWKAVRKEFGDEKAWELIEKAEG